MGLAPFLPEPRSAIPANSGEGPPRFWSPELRRRRPPTWLAWPTPSDPASGPHGPQLTGLTQSTADWAGPVTDMRAPPQKLKKKKKRKMFYK